MSDDETHDRLAGALLKFNSTKGRGVKEPKIDKRSESSKVNMAKARAAKVALSQTMRQKREQEIEVSDEDDSEDSESEEEEEYVLKKAKKGKGKGKGQAAPPAATSADLRIDKLEFLLEQHIKNQKGKGKKKAPVRKTIIHVAPATAASQPVIAQPNPKAADAKKEVLSWFQ